MKNISLATIDKLEKDAIKRFEEAKAKAVQCEKIIAFETEKRAEIIQELARIQGEFKTIQNLKQAGGEKLTANKK